MDQNSAYTPTTTISTYAKSLSSLSLSVHNTTDFPVMNSSANESTPNLKRDEDLVKVEIAIQAIILFLAVFGNATVLLVLCLRRKKLSRMNLLIVHLSLADLFVAFFNILPQLIWDVTFRFQGNDFLCRSVKFLQVAAMYASSYVLVTTAIDRYLAICHPLTSHTWSPSKVHKMVAIAWGLSLFFSIPQIIIFAYREIMPGVHECWGVFDPIWTVRLYVTWFTVAVYIVPASMLILAYGRICFVVWRSVMSKEPSTRVSQSTKRSKSRDTDNEPENGKLLNRSVHESSITEVRIKKDDVTSPRAHVRSMSRAKLKTVKLTLTVIICYLLCWSPFFISQIWSAWDPNAPFQGL